MEIVYKEPINAKSQEFLALTDEQKKQHIIYWRDNHIVNDMRKKMGLNSKKYYILTNELSVPHLDKKDTLKRAYQVRSDKMNQRKADESNKEKESEENFENHRIKDMSELMLLAGVSHEKEAKQQIDKDMIKIEEMSKNQFNENVYQKEDGMKFRYSKTLSGDDLARKLKKLADQLAGENIIVRCEIVVEEIGEEERM